MIFGWIGATGLYFGFLFGLRMSGVVYMGYYAMRYCWWHAVLQIGGDGCHNIIEYPFKKETKGSRVQQLVLIISRAPFNMFSFRSWLLRGQFLVWSTSILDDKLH